MKEDGSMYVKLHKECYMIVSFYVNDILLTWNNLEMLDNTMCWLASIFEVKEMVGAIFVFVVKNHLESWKNF